MNSSVIPFGTQIAVDVPGSSINSVFEVRSPRTLNELLQVWENDPPRCLPVLRTTCNLLAVYLNGTMEQILLDSVKKNKDGFRKFLEDRKYKENSVRTYVNHVRILLNSASELGWEATVE